MRLAKQFLSSRSGFNHHHNLIKPPEKSPFIRILFVLGSETEGEQTAKE